MGLFNSRPVWYTAGLAFECQQCGRCCAGPEEGYIWATDAELTAIASFLGLSETQVRQRYVRRVGKRQSLTEDSRTHDCIFLAPNSSCTGKGCSIYEIRPTQCRTWPFWPINLTSPDAWAGTAARCGGINRGRLFLLHEIQARRDATEQ